MNRTTKDDGLAAGATRGKRLSTRAKVALTAVTIGGTAAVVGLGTFGAWTSTTAAEAPTYSGGTVTLDYGASGATNRLAVGAAAMAPGDTAERGFTLRNSGTLNFATVSFGVTAPTTSLLDSSATNGLTVKIQKCSTGWVESTTTPYTYSCGAGAITTVLVETPVATVKATPLALTGLSSLTGGASDSLKATFELPTAANNTVQGQSSGLSLTFTATQRARLDK